MADLRDYIRWRGDLTFEQSPFNEVDNLIFSYISYINFSGVVPEHAGDDAGQQEGKITIREACRRFWELHTEQEVLENPTMTRPAPFVFRDLADSRRFGELYLSDYRNEIDEGSQKQFSAIKIHLGENRYYLAFRGTDETIVGWQEDFNMVCVPEVPSEKRAVEYLQEALQHRESPAEQKPEFYIGGHSKGGHLAIYAAVHCYERFRDQIIQVYNNDGPGVSAAVAAGDAYQELLPRLVSYVPEQSFFGLMLVHEETTYTVKSSRSGLMQHDCLSWEVLGTEFVRVQEVSAQSRKTNDGLKKWIDGLTAEERQKITELIFSSLSLAGIRNIGDFAALTPKKLYDMVHKLKDMDAEQKALVNRAFRLLIHALKGKEK
ncbi:MAG: Mbeg1-like protein [Lachnospiraceae bacterium]